MPDGTLSRTEEITQIMRDEILRGQYRAGERLPSERDVAARFETSRGTVREAYKKLEQLGVASIQPGGARVVPVQECTLDVLGPLLELNDLPDPQLVDQALDVGAVLFGYAAEVAVEKGDPTQLARVDTFLDEILAAEADVLREMRAPRRLARLFAEASNHLVLLLITNGLRSQFPEPKRALAFPPRLDPKVLKRIAAELKDAVGQRNAPRTGSLMKELIGLVRAAVKTTLAAHGPQGKEVAS